MAFLGEKELTEGMKEKLIEKLIVYPRNRIEIVWKFERYLSKVLVNNCVGIASKHHQLIVTDIRYTMPVTVLTNCT